MKLTAVYEREEGWYVVTCPEIPGTVTQGRDLAEARAMIHDAALLMLEEERPDLARQDHQWREVFTEETK